MSQSKTLVLAAAMSAAVFAALAAAPARAQDQPATADQSENQPIQEVVVTGSRIAVSPNATSASPIQVISSQSIQATGLNDISNVMNQLPQIFNNDLGQDLGNRTSGLTTAGGVATADLRGLGPNRTLVLIDGRRLGQGSPYTFIQSPAPDLDQIPLYMVDHIEVLTGGASSVYGSDAVAGVVNFILKKNFEGIQVDVQLGQNWHDNHNSYAQSLNADSGGTPLTGGVHDGRTRTFSLIMGTNFADGNGNITGWFNYTHQDPVTSGDRDFGQCSLAGNSSDNAPTIGGQTAIDSAVCNGSSNSNYFRTAGTSQSYSVLGNNFVPRGSAATTPPASFNSQPYIFMQRQYDQYLAGFDAHFYLNDHAKPYAQFNLMDNRTHQEVAPAALFRSSNPLDPATNNYYVNCGNPFLSAQQEGILGCTPAQITAGATQSGALDPANQINVEIGRRNIEGGGRVSDYEHTNYRAVFGVKGDIVEGWSYDAWGQFYYTEFFNSNDKYFNFQSIGNALLVVNGPNGPMCANVTASGCVPYNIFRDGGVTPDALQYLYAIGTGQGETTLRTYHADITGELGQYGVKSPLANDGAAVNFGWEHRNENVKFTPDGLEQSGLLSGFGSAAVAINNSQAVDEAFIEAQLPVVQDKPFAKDVTLKPGLRHSNYSVSGSVNTYKLDMTWTPVEDFKVRGSWQRAIRAPSLVELYNPQLVGLIQLEDDPCGVQEDGSPPTASLANCLHTVSPAQAAAFTAAYNGGTIPQATVGQLSQLTGGNVKLKPEIATSFSAGVVFTPTAIPNLTGSIDWWQIRIDDEIGVLPANAILNGCIQTANPLLCGELIRNPNTFSLTGATIAGGGYIVQTDINVAAAEEAGIDLQLSYRLNLPAALGAVRFNLNGVYLQRNLTTPYAGAHTYDCAGLFGSTCQTVNPRWRHILNATWSTPWSVDLGANWRFIGKVGLDNNDLDETLHFASLGAYDTFDAHMPNISYLDLYAVWHTPLKGLEVRAGMNNVLDKDPPLATFEITAGGAANTYSTYDQLGRQMYIAFTAKF